MRLILLSFILLVPFTTSAQRTSPPVLGTWNGRSSCLITPSACHNEVVVYEIRRDSAGTDSLTIKADKIVNGVRDWMGDINCAWHAPALTCPIKGGRFGFTLRGDTLSGWLDLTDGRRFREIVVTRAR